MQAFLVALAMKVLERLFQWALVAFKQWKDAEKVEEAAQEFKNATGIQEKKDAFKKLVGISRPKSE